jgi:HEAT repeat protein
MESHLIGDPTFHFSSVNGLDLKGLISLHQKDLAYWKKMLQSEDIPLRSLSIAMLYKNLGQKYEKDLVDLYRKDASFNIRMQCMKYIAEINSPVFHQMLKESILDPYELVRRISADWMGKSGLKEYLPIMAKRMLTDESDRVSYNLKSTMVFIDPVAAYEECAKALDQMPFNENKDKIKETLKSSILRNKEWLEKELIPGITSDTLKLKKKISNVRTFRNYTFEQAIPVLISLAKNQKEDKDLRASVLEALGWYALSANKDIIVQACEEIIKDSSNPKEVIDEATKTKNRIKEGYSNLITS